MVKNPKGVFNSLVGYTQIPPLGGQRVLIHFERNNHLKHGDISLKLLFAVQILHGIGSIHLSHFGMKITTANVLVTFAGL